MPEDEEGGTLPEAHPAFAAHFTDPIYDSDGDEFAPFGSDEGADMVAEWGERRSELGPGGSIPFILGDGDPAEGAEVVQELDESDPDQVDAAVLIVSAGFTLLRLTGSISQQDKQLVMAALDHLERFYDAQPEFARMRADLGSFEN